MYSAAVIQTGAALQELLRLAAAVRLDDADDDVVAVLPAGARLLQHLVGLADAGGGADEDAELAGTALLPPGRLEQRLRRWPLISVAPVTFDICKDGASGGTSATNACFNTCR